MARNSLFGIVVALALLYAAPSRASLECDGTWTAGVWLTTVWTDGVWFEEDCNPGDPGSIVGIPEGWFSILNALADQDFVQLMREEADGDAVWAYWLPGDVPHNSANLKLDLVIVREEANTTAVWARWAPGTQPGNTGNLQINMLLAIDANFL